ncbi:hypothetical protein [Nitrosospira sp. Nsp1]|uniref:hypothetical protein n=1 Tax=Nitrosospira sp. Nsp1 TaxID=136547 RepID=UPI00087F158D|nr:hypothetical protein [Nitrosospira sp. Nsp1]SCX57583.1 hypothetical protein SAMN05720354_1205 [Nitrosospira sp. Nsp1]
MTIKSYQGPSDGLTVMAAALAARAPAKTAAFSPLGGASHAGGPVPFYHLSLDNLQNDTALEQSVQTGWRYPVLGSSKAGLVDIRGEEGAKGASFGGLSHGIVTERFLEASALADKQLAGSAEEYEPRLLDVPALNFIALWLVGSRQHWFVPLLEGQPPGSASLQMLPTILPLLRSRAVLRVATGSGRPSTGPTN